MALFRKKKIEKREPDVSPWVVRSYGTTLAGPSVTDDTFLGVAAAWRGVELLSNAVATLPIDAYRGDEEVEPRPKILERPNPRETRIETMFALMNSLILRGNAYAALGEFDKLNYPQSLLVLHPDQVLVSQEDDGRITYRIGNVVFEKEEVLHIKGFCLPGAIKGVGVIEAQRQGIGHSIALGRYAQRYFSEGAVPNSLLKVGYELAAEEAAALKAAWVNAYANGNREPAVIGSDVEYVPLSFSPEDSQFLQSRQFSLLEIAHMLGIPPYFLGAEKTSMTYSNVEQESLNFVRWSLRPWLVRIEQAISDLLPRGTQAKFNIDAILRADTLTRYQAHAIALEKGFLTLDEVRSLEDRKPLPKPRVPAMTEEMNVSDSDLSPDEPGNQSQN